jgi:hypothetical protein
MVALGLAIPPGHAGQPMGNVLDLDIKRRRVQQVKPAPRKHPLPGAKFGCHLSVPASSLPHGGGS